MQNCLVIIAISFSWIRGSTGQEKTRPNYLYCHAKYVLLPVEMLITLMFRLFIFTKNKL